MDPFQAPPSNFYNSLNNTYQQQLQQQQFPQPQQFIYQTYQEPPRDRPVSQNVCLVDQHRKIWDAVTTETCNYVCPQQQLPPQPQFLFDPSYASGNFPAASGGYCAQTQPVMYNQYGQYGMPQMNPAIDYQNPQINLNQLQNRAAMELACLQNQLSAQNSCYNLKLHLDHQTSTTDLVSGVSKIRADSKNSAASLLSNWPPWLQNDPPNKLNHKQLIIKNAENPNEERSSSRSVAAVLLDLEAQAKDTEKHEEDKQETKDNSKTGYKKRIKFEDETSKDTEKLEEGKQRAEDKHEMGSRKDEKLTADVQTQIHVCCNCNGSKTDSKKEDSMSNSSATEDSDSYPAPNKTGRKKKSKRHQR